MRSRGTPPTIQSRNLAEYNTQVAECKTHLLAIGRALKAYQRDHGKSPALLSDLYPKYISDKRLFHCPVDPTRGTATPDWEPNDPKMPISYAYFESTIPNCESRDLLGLGYLHSWSEWHQAMMVQFGDVVPIIRCGHHWLPHEIQKRWTMLTLRSSGVVEFAPAAFEEDPGALLTVLRRFQQSLRSGWNGTARNWSLPNLEHYLSQVTVSQRLPELQRPDWFPPKMTEQQRLQAREAARGILALSKTVPSAQKNGVCRVAARCYVLARDTAGAVDAYRQALEDPELTAVTLADLYQDAGKPIEAATVLEAGDPASGKPPSCHREAVADIQIDRENRRWRRFYAQSAYCRAKRCRVPPQRSLPS